MQLVLECGPALGSSLASARRWHGPLGALAVHLAVAVLWLAWPAAPTPGDGETVIEMVLAPPPPPPVEAPKPPPAPQPVAEPVKPPPPAPAAPVHAPAPKPRAVAAPAASAAPVASEAPATAAAEAAAPASAPVAPAVPKAAAEPDLKPAPAEAPRPAYPRAARQRGWQGLVLVLVRVTEDGVPQEVSVKESSGHSVLDDAALEAVRRWRFTPARQAGHPVAAAVEVPVRFSLEG